MFTQSKTLLRRIWESGADRPELHTKCQMSPLSGKSCDAAKWQEVAGSRQGAAGEGASAHKLLDGSAHRDQLRAIHAADDLADGSLQDLLYSNQSKARRLLHKKAWLG